MVSLSPEASRPCRRCALPYDAMVTRSVSQPTPAVGAPFRTTRWSPVPVKPAGRCRRCALPHDAMTTRLRQDRRVWAAERL